MGIQPVPPFFPNFFNFPLESNHLIPSLNLCHNRYFTSPSFPIQVASPLVVSPSEHLTSPIPGSRFPSDFILFYLATLLSDLSSLKKS